MPKAIGPCATRWPNRVVFANSASVCVAADRKLTGCQDSIGANKRLTSARKTTNCCWFWPVCSLCCCSPYQCGIGSQDSTRLMCVRNRLQRSASSSCLSGYSARNRSMRTPSALSESMSFRQRAPFHCQDSIGANNLGYSLASQFPSIALKFANVLSTHKLCVLMKFGNSGVY